MLVLVVYDIPDNKRRTKLSKFLEGYGERVQWSVFECFLSLEEMRVLYQKVKKRVEPLEDNVRFYWISNEAVSRVLTIGGESPSPPPNYYLI
ncbi:CRISPR-associated protein Cas2 (plasmid) [Gloeothece citriformis PCC 7424]|uniref:CRISPR-associated endoribonuclease Cas2 n=1 Tax=Gloeothece citriformis (strain PCC 7424) TaxID=65393 RepID=B7KM78_GLOC7|nr:CRISPR-associated endonuclease Cas2 [Gloeothece citriformis]ACK73900.1 CRISPR-associated protein Cas2 [Gloeothece citriformis PCC 7424]